MTTPTTRLEPFFAAGAAGVLAVAADDSGPGLAAGAAGSATAGGSSDSAAGALSRLSGWPPTGVVPVPAPVGAPGPGEIGGMLPLGAPVRGGGASGDGLFGGGLVGDPACGGGDIGEPGPRGD